MRIILDLGTSYACRYMTVGIVRTERQFARYLMRRGDVDVAFCRFDPAIGGHVAIDLEQVETLMAQEASVAVPETAAALQAAGPPRSSWRLRASHMARAGAEAVLRVVPEAVRPNAESTLIAGRDFARAVARLAVQCVRLTARPFDKKVPPVMPRAEPFAFETDDVYVSFGSDWLFNDLTRIRQARDEVGFAAILFCYDAIPVLFPHLMPIDMSESFAKHLAELAQTADHVLAISQNTKDDLLAVLTGLGVGLPSVDVVHLGSDIEIDEAEVRPPAPDLEGSPFVLCVGTLEIRKNPATLYHVWDRLLARHGDRLPRLVFAGSIGWGVDDVVRLIRANPRTKAGIRIVERVTDGELSWLYRHCLFTVYPSIYEGWGLPVAESLAAGKPCITSNAAAITEASQGLAESVDPLDVPGLERAVERLWLDDATREHAISEVTRRFRPPTWAAFGDSVVALALELHGRKLYRVG